MNMMKHMKKAISFFMAVCLLAGNSYINTEATTTVNMSEWTQVAEVHEPLLPKGLLNYLENKDFASTTNYFIVLILKILKEMSANLTANGHQTQLKNMDYCYCFFCMKMLYY